MKAMRFAVVCVVTGLVLSGCTGFFGGTGGGSGVAVLESSPTYDTTSEELVFTLTFQYSDYQQHSAVDIDYDILDASDGVITSGSATTTSYDEYGATWTTDEVRVSVSRATYSGQTVTIFVDPDARLTASGLQFLEEDRRYDVVIP